MDKKSFQTETQSSLYNSNWDLLLAKTSAGVINDAAWWAYVRDNLLVSFAPIKAAFDAGQDLPPLEDIDPNAWMYPPIVADPLAVPPIIGYAGRLKYPVGLDTYRTEAADLALQKDRAEFKKDRLELTKLNQDCMTRLLKTIPHYLQEDILEGW